MTKWKDALDADLLKVQDEAQRRMDAAVVQYQKHRMLPRLEYDVGETNRAREIARARKIAEHVVAAMEDEQVAELFTLALNLRLIDDTGKTVTGSQIFNHAMHDRLVTKMTRRKP